MANYTPNFNLYKPNIADTTIDVAPTLDTNFTTIDTEIKNRKDEIDNHKSSTTAHDSVNITHGDGNVKDAIFELNGQITTLGGRADGVDGQITELGGRVTGAESRVTELESRTDTTEKQLDQITAASSIDPQVSQALVGGDGRTYVNIGNRFDTVDSSLTDNTQLIKDISVNVKDKQFGAKGDGVTDDTTAIQSALDSLKVKTGVVFFPYGSYKITSSLVVPDTVQLVGVMGSRYGKNGSDVKNSVILWGGAINTAMVTFNKNGGKVMGSRISNMCFDGNNISGVIGIDLTLSSYTKIFGCDFTQVAVGIQLSGNAYYNDILFNTFEYFTDSGVKFLYTTAFTNDITIIGNYFGLMNANNKGVYVKEANSIRIAFNRFEGSKAGTNFVLIEGSGCRDVTITENRMENLWNLDTGDVPTYAISVKKDSNGYQASNTRISNNQIYSQEIKGGVTYVNGLFDVLDEGFGTIIAQKHGQNLVPNGGCVNVNGLVPLWKSNDAASVIGYDATSGRMKLTVTNTSVKFPLCYLIFDAKPYRGKNLTISTKFKADNITTKPRIEVQCFKSGDGTVGNKGTYINGNTTELALYKPTDDQLLFSTITIPTDADHFFINLNSNGSGATTPANNNIYIDFVCLAEIRTLFLDKSKDLVYNLIDKPYITSNRPAGVVGLRVFDSTLNKPIWFDGTNWRDATGTIV